MTTQYYVGDKAIRAVIDAKNATPLGTKVVNVVFEDGTQESLTEKTFKNIRTEKPVDATELRRLRCEPLVQEILVMMLETNIKWNEIDYVMGLVVESLNANSESASNKLWGVESVGDRTMLDIDTVLKRDESAE